VDDYFIIGRKRDSKGVYGALIMLFILRDHPFCGFLTALAAVRRYVVEAWRGLRLASWMRFGTLASLKGLMFKDHVKER